MQRLDQSLGFYLLGYVDFRLVLISRPTPRLLSFARICHRKRLPGCSQ